MIAVRTFTPGQDRTAQKAVDFAFSEVAEHFGIFVSAMCAATVVGLIHLQITFQTSPDFVSMQFVGLSELRRSSVGGEYPGCAINYQYFCWLPWLRGRHASIRVGIVHDAVD